MSPVKSGQARREIARLSDSQVVQRFLADDEQRAFAELVRRYERRLQYFVVAMIGDRERAEDLVQETFVRVWRHIGRSDQPSHFSTRWIYTIARNLARNELRSRSRNPVVLFQSLCDNGSASAGCPLPEPEDPAPRPDQLYRERVIREMIHHAAGQLRRHHRTVFVLRELQGRTYAEISELMECSLGTVKSRLSRARRHLARLIGDSV